MAAPRRGLPVRVRRMSNGASGDLVGAILNKEWRLVRRLGEGGLATVYEADGLHGQGRRALKLLHPQFHGNRIVVERFYAEAKACYALRHPHIVSVEAYAYAEDGSPYLVMELLAGLSLEDYLKKYPPIPPVHAAQLLFGVLQALSLAHASGVVHRDLKPPNLFLLPDPNAPSGQHIKVLDFGIAKVMDLAGGMASKTRTGVMLGTPGYMSPEQIKNAKAVDARSDLWAAGIVFYEMLTHQHPFGEDDDMGRVVMILRGQARPIEQVSPGLAAWGPFFERALATDPAQRFQSAEEMATTLRELALGAGAHAAGAARITGGVAANTAGALDADGLPVSAAMPLVQRGAPVAGPGPGYRAEPAGKTLASRGHESEAWEDGRQHGVVQFPNAYSPMIGVESARRLDPPSLVWWAVLVLGLAAFGAGLLCGYVLGAT
ncbi:MAG: serine/threonine protein kinase [Myxococcales bacterium]|nr:serine/threonine protein kinase [Myxococcales bacterium]